MRHPWKLVPWLALVLVATGCGGSSTPAAPAAPAGDQPVKVALITKFPVAFFTAMEDSAKAYDDATPGIGSKNLAEIGPAEKTTPAGRFLAKYGSASRERVLWVDYATSVALHPIPKTASKKEKRRERMLSATSEDNRITFGCINVPMAFYSKSLGPLFRKRGGYVYVLPDTKTLEEVFPRLRVVAMNNGGAQTSR